MIDTGNMNTFEIILNEQTPKVQEIADIKLYLKMHRPYLLEFLEDCRGRLNAAGMACNQLNLNGDRFMVRAFAHRNLGTDSNGPIWKLIIDPKIIEYVGMKEIKCEGCLTWKGKIVVVERSRAVRVSYYDIDGEFHTDEFHRGFDAQVWQHEINHLNGVEEQIEELDYQNKIKRIDIQRNDLCPCGSGKKYKLCCLSYL
jgi:peptide deformylase